MDKSPKDKGYLHTSISSGFNQHTPAYWRLALPALGARYGFRWLERISQLGEKKALGIGSKQIFDAAAGLWMMGITGFFAANTWRDMRRVFAETVAYELDKDPRDVSAKDILNSDNKALAKARGNFFRFNAVRALVNTTFFASFLPSTKRFDFKSSESVDLGLGANGFYLVGEVVTRNGTFFEQLQDFIDRKVNQKNALGEDIRAIELMRLFERNALDNDPQNAYRGNVNTLVWEQSTQIFERIADLMNNTYQHTSTGQRANFALPKFLYLIGHNLIQPKRYEQTMAYVEVANRYGMDALKKVVKSVQDGTDLADALRAYPVTIPPCRFVSPAPAPAEKRFAQDMTPAGSFSDKALNRKEPGAADISFL